MVRPSKDKKDATTMPPSKEMRKTRKVNKGPSALDIVKKKYKGQIMKVEELDLTKVAEAFGGYIVEQTTEEEEKKKNKNKRQRKKLDQNTFDKTKEKFFDKREVTGGETRKTDTLFQPFRPDPEEIEKMKPKDKVTTGSGEDTKGQKDDVVTYGQPDEVKPKQGRLSKIATAAAANPAAALVAYDLGKGIIGKISKLRAPAVVGGKAGFRSAGGYQAT